MALFEIITIDSSTSSTESYNSDENDQNTVADEIKQVVEEESTDPDAESNIYSSTDDKSATLEAMTWYANWNSLDSQCASTYSKEDSPEIDNLTFVSSTATSVREELYFLGDNWTTGESNRKSKSSNTFASEQKSISIKRKRSYRNAARNVEEKMTKSKQDEKDSEETAVEVKESTSGSTSTSSSTSNYFTSRSSLLLSACAASEEQSKPTEEFLYNRGTTKSPMSIDSAPKRKRKKDSENAEPNYEEIGVRMRKVQNQLKKMKSEGKKIARELTRIRVQISK